MTSLGTVGNPYDKAVVKSFWARMHVELLNRHRWSTRIELANAIFEYIEGFTTAVGADRSAGTPR